MEVDKELEAFLRLKRKELKKLEKQLESPSASPTLHLMNQDLRQQIKELERLCRMPKDLALVKRAKARILRNEGE